MDLVGIIAGVKLGRFRKTIVLGAHSCLVIEVTIVKITAIADRDATEAPVQLSHSNW